AWGADVAEACLEAPEVPEGRRGWRPPPLLRGLQGLAGGFLFGLLLRTARATAQHFSLVQHLADEHLVVIGARLADQPVGRRLFRNGLKPLLKRALRVDFGLGPVEAGQLGGESGEDELPGRVPAR